MGNVAARSINVLGMDVPVEHLHRMLQAANASNASNASNATAAAPAAAVDAWAAERKQTAAEWAASWN